MTLGQWFLSISDNGPKAISGEVCGATSEIFLKPSTAAFMHIRQYSTNATVNVYPKLSYISAMGCCTKH